MVSYEVRLLALPVVATLATAHDRTVDRTRELVVVCAQTDDGEGWGECSALNRPGYSAEWAAGAFDVLAEGTPAVEVFPMAAAAVEMALLDARLKREGRSLADYLGAGVEAVPAGVAIGLGEPSRVMEDVAQAAAEGFRRVKVKVVPGASVDIIAGLVSAHSGLEVQVDANGSFGSEHLRELMAMADVGVSAIEQPFAPSDLDALRRLYEAVEIPVVADESVVTFQDAQQLQADGLLRAISLKAPRLGGIASASALHDRCVEWGVSLTAGGMLECGLGRHALAALAALPGFTITGDVSPAARWLAEDPWPDLHLSHGSITVPSGPGVAPAPDREALDRFTVRLARR